jgi:two-component system CheB/CheR fusion protein
VIADARLPDHPLIYVNAAFETITGYSRSDVLGRNCRFLQGGATDRETVAEIRAALDAGDECTRVVLNFRKDGSPFWNELRISPVHDNAGVLTHFIGIQHVTERLTAKLEAERLSDYNKLLLESTGNGVYAMDTTGVCLYINRAGARMMGYEPDEVLGLHAHQLFHHSHADGSPYPAEDCPIYRAFLIGKGSRVEDEVFWHQDGVPVPVEYSSFPLLERDNERHQGESCQALLTRGINWEMAWSDKNRLMTAGIASVTRRAGPLYLHLDCEGLTVPPELDLPPAPCPPMTSRARPFSGNA